MMSICLKRMTGVQNTTHACDLQFHVDSNKPHNSFTVPGVLACKGQRPTSEPPSHTILGREDCNQDLCRAEEALWVLQGFYAQRVEAMGLSGPGPFESFYNMEQPDVVQQQPPPPPHQQEQQQPGGDGAPHQR